MAAQLDVLTDHDVALGGVKLLDIGPTDGHLAEEVAFEDDVAAGRADEMAKQPLAIVENQRIGLWFSGSGLTLGRQERSKGESSSEKRTGAHIGAVTQALLLPVFVTLR